MKLSDLTQDTKTIALYDDQLHITFSPTKITPNSLMRVEALDKSNTGASVAVLVDLLMDILVSWDLTQDDGTPVALTVDSLKALPMSFITQLLGTLTSNMTMGEVNGVTTNAA